MSLSRVREAFDGFAAIDAGRDRGLGPHERELLDTLPKRVGFALDVGCGAGAVSRALTRRAERVVGVDVSTETLALARRRSASFAGLSFLLGDALSLPFRDAAFDCVVSVAVLHHLEAERALAEWVRVLRPGGSLLVIDVVERPGLRQLPKNALAWLAKQASDLARDRSLGTLRARRAFWREHAHGERHPTMAEARRAYEPLLPGAAISEHLLWRYSICWQRPAGAGEGR